jgi:membrane protein DedA with SNARE-associated domain
LDITELVARYGYAIVAVLVFAEGLGLPLPGETALLAAAALAGHPMGVAHHMSIYLVIVAAAVGGTAGGTAGYWLGRTGGQAFLQRHGRHVGLDASRLQRLRTLFERHGFRTVLVSRFISLLRIVAAWLAGVSHMPFGSFTIANTTGAILWAVAFGALGYVFGSNLPRLEHTVGRAGLFALLAVIVFGAIVLARRRRRVAASQN